MNLQSQRIKNAIYFFISSIFLNIGPLLLGLWLLPKIVHLLSEERFGVYKTLAELVGFLGVFTVSYAASLNQKFARQKNKTELFLILKNETSYSAQLALFWVFIVGPVLIIASPSSIGPTIIPKNEIYLGAFIGILSLIWLPSLVLQAFFESQQHGYKTNYIYLAQRILIVAGSYLLAYYWPTIGSQFLIIFIAGGLAFLAQWIMSISKQIPITLNPTLTPIKNFKQNLKNRLIDMVPFLKIDFAGRLSMSGDILLISWLINNTAVSHFYLAMRLPSLFLNQLMAFGNSIWAGFADLYNSGETEKYIRTFKVSTKLILWCSSLSAGIIILLNEPFLKIWYKNDLEVSSLFYIISGLNLIPISLISLWGWILTAIHKEHVFGKVSSQAAMLNIFLGIVLTQWINLAGPLAASLIAYGIFKILLIIQPISEGLKISKREILFLGVRPLGFSLIFFSIILFVVHKLFEINSWLTLIITTIIVILLYSSLAWVLVLESSEKNFFLNFLKKNKK